MKLVTYRTHPAGAGILGVIIDDLVIDLEEFGATIGQPLPGSMLEFIDLGPTAGPATAAMLEDAEGVWPLGVALPVGDVTLLAPIPRTRKNIFGIG
ncbi:MAG: hypothetical protein ACI932_001251, partial [Paracoccaceae bacterium]